MNFFKGLIIFLSLIGASQSFAEQRPILLISDIDDTIKMTDVVGNAKKFLTVFHVIQPFSGMAALYQLIVNENPSLTKVFYVSNAPEGVGSFDPFKDAAMKLISKNHFPQGELRLRQNILDQTHKVNTVRDLVHMYNPRLVIMIGDNGERDVYSYKQLSDELNFQKINNVTYIHQVYSTNSEDRTGQPLQLGQIGFATSVELAIDLNQKGLLKQESVNWMFDKVVPYIYSESYFDKFSPRAFPSFMDCSDFKWVWMRNSQNSQYANFLEKKCH